MSTLVSIFGCTTNCSLFNKKSFADINKLATSYGFIVTPDASNEDTYNYLMNNSFNPNMTLYNSWSQITSKSRLQLFVEQLLHYASTYGTDFEGEPLIFRDGDYTVEFNNFKLIDAVSNDEMFELCMKQLSSGAALNSDDVKTIMNYIVWYIKKYSYNVDKAFNMINNNEAKLIFIDTFNIFPKNGVEFFKFLVYKATNETMIVINEDMYNKIICSYYKLPKMTEDDLKTLAECFNRFKYLFMAFKKSNRSNKPIVNKIRRYAKTYHKPLKQMPSMNIVNSFYNDFNNLDKELKTTTNFRLVSLLNYLYSLENESSDSMYIIRNGKSFVKETLHKNNMNVRSVINYVRNILVNNLKTKAGIIKYNEFVDLACPTSTKNFIGEFPFGTSVNMSKDNYIGIYWENAWGTRDFDLSLIDVINSIKVGWNSSYYNRDQTVIYSGDITNAPNGASEVIKINNFDDDGLLLVNRFNGESNSKFIVFGGTSNKPFNNKSKYMVDPNTIVFKDVCISTNKESVVGFVTNNKLYFMSFPYTNARVSSTNKEQLNNALRSKVTNYLNLKEILNDAGFIEFNSEIHETCDYDFTEINKNTLIELFS